MDHILFQSSQLHGAPQDRGQTSVAAQHGACAVVSSSRTRGVFVNPQSQWYLEANVFQETIDETVHLATLLIYITYLRTPDAPHSL